MFGFPAVTDFTPNRWLNDGDTVTVGKQTLQVLYTPGHTPGHIIFFHGPSKLAMVGDVLFAGSIGRTDFPRGNHQHLINSIRSKLWPLGNDVAFIPGHGPMSTFGQERLSNHYVGDHVRLVINGNFFALAGLIRSILSLLQIYKTSRNWIRNCGLPCPARPPASNSTRAHFHSLIQTPTATFVPKN